jgi:transposase
VSYNVSLVALLNHYGALPRACRPYRAKTKGKVERPYRYIRQTSSSAGPSVTSTI